MIFHLMLVVQHFFFTHSYTPMVLQKLLQRYNANAQDLSKLFIELIPTNCSYLLILLLSKSEPFFHVCTTQIFVLVFYDQFWYLVVANFQYGRFEVLIPNLLFEVVKTDAETVILNFKRMFNYACPHSTKVHIWAMNTVYRSVTYSKNLLHFSINIPPLISFFFYKLERWSTN